MQCGCPPLLGLNLIHSPQFFFCRLGFKGLVDSLGFIYVPLRSPQRCPVCDLCGTTIRAANAAGNSARSFFACSQSGPFTDTFLIQCRSTARVLHFCPSFQTKAPARRGTPPQPAANQS